MYYSYVQIEYVAASFSPARMDLALKLLNLKNIIVVNIFYKACKATTHH